MADDLAALARREPPTADWERPPVHADRYLALLPGRVGWGPAFQFPASLAAPAGVVEVHDETPLHRHFRGWVAGEIAAGAGPVRAVLDGGDPVSVCFCARRSAVAAEAGAETAPAFRGRGYAPRAVAAWAAAVRAGGLTPLYSTGWDNPASLAVARALGLAAYATDWSIDR